MPEFTPKTLLSSYTAHPLVLDLYLVKHLGTEYYLWEPETVWAEAMRVAKAPNISEVNKNKIQAIRTVHLTDSVFKRWEVYEKVVIALNSIIPRFDVMQKPDLGQFVLGVSTIYKLRSDTFSEEVAAYTAAALLADGVLYGPPPLEFCNQPLANFKDVPHGLIAKIKAALESGATSEDETIQRQLAKIKEAKLYSAEASKNLLEQLRLLHESDPAPSLSR